MAGSVKPKSFDWKATNLALFGTDTEKAVKKESALREPAWKPVLACREPRLFLWRIEKFQVKVWTRHGTFYNGDTFIVLNVYKRNANDAALRYDVHFWIGKYSTADEYGTAAYKTVELDTALDGKAVQYREVEDYESEKFRSYFKSITILKGGVESGFNQVTAQEYHPRLLLAGERLIKEVSLRTLTDSDGVWILDLGLKLFQMNGAKSRPADRFHASTILEALRDERNGRATYEVLEEADMRADHEFYTTLAAYAKRGTKSRTDNDRMGKRKKDARVVTALYAFENSDNRASPKHTNIRVRQTAQGKVYRAQLDESSVNLLVTANRAFVYIGAQAKQSWKRNALSCAHNYLASTPQCIMPITVISAAAGQTDSDFEAAFRTPKGQRCIVL